MTLLKDKTPEEGQVVAPGVPVPENKQVLVSIDFTHTRFAQKWVKFFRWSPAQKVNSLLGDRSKL